MTTATDRKEGLEALQRELEQQRDALRKLHAMAASLGNVEIAVPRHVLDQIIGSNLEPAVPVMGVRA
ncbi:MAG TPA: hypothetical protein VGM06_17765 [Polyangiaceae bacterium]|jgi:hypothetical protein